MKNEKSKRKIKQTHKTKKTKSLTLVIALIKQENSYNDFIEYKEMRKNVNEKWSYKNKIIRNKKLNFIRSLKKKK